MASDDLARQLPQPEALQPMGYRQGVVVSWNPLTAENVVDVGGTQLRNLPILNTSEALLLAAGSVVGLITSGSTWAILGRLTVPNSPDATSALELLSGRIYSESGSSTVTTDTSFVLGDPIVSDVLVSNSGKMLIISTCLISTDVFVNTGGGGLMSINITGATTLPGGDGQGPSAFSSDDNGSQFVSIRLSVAYLETGLNPGLHNVQGKYRALNGAVEVTFGDPNITVFAL